jgi:ADP-dependent NAD(P)H-hydrate dehydratase / NAD(P)H-hydrate epimerase
MKIFSGNQIRQIDNYTIENEPVKSIDLMERAAYKLLEWILANFERPAHFLIFAGPGNNGGDGLALARLLNENRYGVEVFFISAGNKTSQDWNSNSERVRMSPEIKFTVITSQDNFPAVCYNDIIIDAIFGSGLTRPVEGLVADIIRRINTTGNTVISVDIPSGLFTEDNSKNDHDNIIRATHTLTFQFPKLCFLFAENYCFTGEWHVLPIGLHPGAIRDVPSPYYLTEGSEFGSQFIKRKKHDHKGMFGHGLLVAGSEGKMGAAVLASKAALRTGIGLLTCRLPSDGSNILHSTVPETMISSDESSIHVSKLPPLEPFNSVGVGPGLGKHEDTFKMMDTLFEECSLPLVIDADAINIISEHRKLIEDLPAGTILTPHPKEFERLAGKTSDSYSRLYLQIAFAEKYKCIVILKGAYTSIALPDGRVYFNSTGNPGMATAGSGDVLTGMILSLLAQGYSPEDASIKGVYLHGLAGDFAAKEKGYESMIASDIIDNIGNAFNFVRLKSF